MQSSSRSRHVCPYCVHRQRHPRTLIEISVGRCNICLRMRPHSDSDVDWYDLSNPYWPPPGLLWNWNERMYETRPRHRGKSHSKNNHSYTPAKLKLRLPCLERRREPLIISEPTLEATTANIVADPIPFPAAALRRQRSDPSMDVSSPHDISSPSSALERHHSSPSRTGDGLSPVMEYETLTARTISPVGTYLERPRRRATFEDTDAIGAFAIAAAGTDRPMSQTYVINLPLQGPSPHSDASRQTISDESPLPAVDPASSQNSSSPYGADSSLSAQRRRQVQRNTYLFSQAVQGLHYPVETARKATNPPPEHTNTQQEAIRRTEKRRQAQNRAEELERQWKTSNSNWRYG